MRMPWYGELPEWWERKQIRVIFSENTESNAELKSLIPMQFRFGEIVKKRQIEHDDAFFESTKRYTIIQDGDIIVNGLNLNYDFVTQRVAIVHETGCITPAYISLRKKEKINSQFFCYILKAMDAQKIFHGLGTGIRLTLGYSELKKEFLPLPPRSEQDQIVHYLDWKVSRINKLISAKRKQITLLQEQKREIIRETVTKGGAGWRQLRIKVAAKILRGKFSHRPRNDPDFYDGKYPFIQTGDVARAGKYIRKYRQTLNDKGYAVSKQFPKGTLVMTIAANIGDVAILDFDACFPDSIIGFIPNKYIDLEYLYYSFFSMKADFINEAPVNTQGNLNIERVGAMTIYAPEKNKQSNIVCRIEDSIIKIDKIIEKMQIEICLFSEYRTRLISDVVTGKLDVRGVVVPEYETMEDVASDEAIDDDTASLEEEDA